jgi:anthranilate phosphoribosyltransferase
MDIRQAIQQVTAGHDLAHAEMVACMRVIMRGDATPAQIGGFLIALRLKGETVEEISAAASVMREFAERVVVDPEHLLDTAGTGGDGAGTFNISTTAAIVAAAAGARVAKHGNRSASGACGSADVLEAAGVRLGLPPAAVATCIEKLGIGFMFAPAHHGAMRHVAGPRRELGVRTIFNLLGPLTNPAGAPNQLIGVFSRERVVPIAEALQRLGSRHVMVCHADDGLDEISIGADTFIAELRGDAIRTYVLSPRQFGIEPCSSNRLAAVDVPTALAILNSVLANEPGPARDIVCVNAGAAVSVAGITGDLAEGIDRARAALASGAAAAKLAELVRLSGELAAQTEIAA